MEFSSFVNPFFQFWASAFLFGQEDASAAHIAAASIVPLISNDNRMFQDMTTKPLSVF